MDEKTTAVEVTPKTKEELNKEYATLCTMTGDWSYRIHCYELDVTSARRRMLQINQEIDKIQDAEKAEMLAKKVELKAVENADPAA